jgi:uncharacterized protein YkuJ
MAEVTTQDLIDIQATLEHLTEMKEDDIATVVSATFETSGGTMFSVYYSHNEYTAGVGE